MNAIDTNVLIYTCDKRDQRFQQTALDLLDTITDGVLLWQVACEFIAASRKLEASGFTTQDAWENLVDFQAAFNFVLPTRTILSTAQNLQLIQGCSFWDAMIYAACSEAGVKRIYSEDLPGSPIPGLEVVNPFAHLK